MTSTNVGPDLRTVPSALRHPLVRMTLTFVAIALMAVPIMEVAHATHLKGMVVAGAHLVAALAAWGIYVASVRRLEGRVVTELSVRDLASRFSVGFGIGSGLFCGTIIALWLSNAYAVTGVNPSRAVLTVFVNALGAALLEEIAVRGVLFRNIEETVGTWSALILSALIFGLLHAANAGATWRDIAGIALEGGLLLAAAYVYARQLWICVGLHCAWNFADGGVFGASGATHSLLSATLHGPDWLTGGRSGLDASLVAMIVCLMATATFLLSAWHRGRIVSVRGRADADDVKA